MRLSDDLLYIKHDDKEKWLLYNHKLNKLCIIDDELYSKIDFIGKVISEFNVLSMNDKTLLIKNGIIVEDEKEYEKMSYFHKLEGRDTSVRLKEAYLHVTQRCNLRCSYCYNKKNLNKPDKLDLGEILDIGTKLKHVGIEHITITGGEPLMRTDIKDICCELKQMGFRLTLLTNGVLLQLKLDALNFVDKMIISVDTFEVNDNLRKNLNINKLKITLINMPILQREKISLRSVISKTNEKSWNEVKNFAIKNNFQFLHTTYLPNAKNEIKYMPDLNINDYDEGILNFSGNLCAATYRVIAVDSNGDLYPCQALISNGLKITNILQNNWYEDLLKSNIVREFAQRSVDKIEKCSSCDYRYLCGGGCRAIARNVYSSLDACAECICPYHKEIVIKKLKGLLLRYG